MARWTPTLPDNKSDAEDFYKPSEQDAKESVGSAYVDAGTDQAEAFANDPANHVGEQEGVGTLPPDTNFTSSYGQGADKSEKLITAANVRAILKRRGPLGLIAALGIGGGIIGTMLLSPGLILVQMKESLVDRFNYQFASMDARTRVMVKSKVAGTTEGICGKKITVACKYRTISADQAVRFKDLGNIDIDGDATKFGNRLKPRTYTFNGITTPASGFMARYDADPDFRSAVHNVYSAEFGGWADRTWNRFARTFGLTKKSVLKGATDAERTESLDDNVKNGRDFDVGGDGITCNESGSSCTDKDGNELSDEERAARRAAIEAAREAGDAAENTAGDAIAKVASPAVNSVANFLKVTGGLDAACQAYSAVRGLGYAAKTVRAIQLARYAMAFVTVADEIKAGTAKPEDVAYLGGILTNVAYDAISGVKRKTAMDSAGMKYTMFGEVGGFRGEGSSYISQFMAGGGLTGDLIVITDYINTALGGGARGTCRTLGNGWVQFGSAAAGIALLFVPGANVAIGAADIVKAGVSVAVSVALAVLPDLLKDIVAGNVTKGAVGEDSGNIIASGFGVIGSGLAQDGGNAIMSKEDAREYLGFQRRTVARYAADETARLSPLDPTSKYTFVGSMVNKLLPVLSNTSDISGSLSKIGSAVGSSFASILPSASALAANEDDDALEICTDPDLNALGAAADPFCNPIFGIPEHYLSRDPVEVANAIGGQYDAETGAPRPDTPYADFVKNCIEREEPIGSGGPDDSGDIGDKCMINDSNANYYLFYLDQRVDQGMNGYYEGGGVDGSKQEIAQQIMDLAGEGKVTELSSIATCRGIRGGSNGCLGMIKNIADGVTDGNSEPCGININILKIILKAAQEYSIMINGINRQCANSTAVTGGTSGGSNHDAGNGSAIDIGSVNGMKSTGRSANDKKLAITLAEAGLLIPGTRFEQKKCRVSIGGLSGFLNGNVPDGVSEFDATECDHMHIDVPASSDPDLIHPRRSFNE